MRVTGLVPARFLTIISHLILVIVIFWSRKPNIESCLPRTYTQAEYDEKDLQLIIGLSVALGLFAIEFIGLFGGLSMFRSFQCLLSISAHCGASVALAYFLWREWPCDRFWYIFGFCNAAPAFTELVTISLVLCCGHSTTAAHGAAFVALVFFLFDYWPCDWYWYIFGFCSAFPGLTEVFTIISSARRTY